jgi:hypothetical protein
MVGLNEGGLSKKKKEKHQLVGYMDDIITTENLSPSIYMILYIYIYIYIIIYIGFV